VAAVGSDSEWISLMTAIKFDTVFSGVSFSHEFAPLGTFSGETMHSTEKIRYSLYVQNFVLFHAIVSDF
jgi:hypothetical protein